MIRGICPNLDDKQLAEARENFGAYIRLVAGVCDEIESSISSNETAATEMDVNKGDSTNNLKTR